MSGRLSRDLPHVMHETIDNEVVVVNLTSGVYYSFDGVGVCVWDWIDGSRTIEEIVQNATEHFDGDHEHIASSVRGFLQKLLEENLVVLGSPESGDVRAVSEHAVATEGGKFVFESVRRANSSEVYRYGSFATCGSNP